MTNWDRMVISVSFGSLWGYVDGPWLIITLWYLIAVVACIAAILDMASKEG